MLDAHSCHCHVCLAPVQDLDEIPKAEAVRALKYCEWAATPGMDDCVALEGTISYFAYSWVAGQSSWIPALSAVLRTTQAAQGGRAGQQ